MHAVAVNDVCWPSCAVVGNMCRFSCGRVCHAHPGFPTIRAEWQKLENPDLRKALKMKVGPGWIILWGGADQAVSKH